MKKYITVPVVALSAIVLTATGVYAAARNFGPADADKQSDRTNFSTCMGKSVTINGTTEVVTGTSGNDVIVSRRYNAEVYGLGGDDTICLYNYGSAAYGGPGRDVIWADGNSEHVLSGGPGDDVLLASNKLVTGLGKGGDNIMIGGPGADKIYGGGDDEWLFGGGGNDYIRGGEGDDYLRGQSGDDNLNGGYGDDDVDDAND